MPHLFTILALSACLAVATAAESKIGVLYIERTFEGSAMVQQVQQGLKAKADQVGAQIEEINGKLEMESTPESSPAHLQANEQFEVLRLRRKLFLERSQKALLGLEVQQLKKCYLKIREVLQDFARDEGYSLVLMAPLPEVSAQRVQDLNLELATHSVLFHQDSMDITEAFTAYLNERASSLGEADEAEAETEAAGAAAEGNAPVIDLGAGE